MTDNTKDTSAEPTAAPAEEAPAPAAAAVMSPGLRGFLGGLAGGIVVSVAAAGALVAAWPAGLHELLMGDEARRIATLERAIDDITPRVVAVERDRAAGGADAGGMVQSLAQKVAALETQIHAPLADSRGGASAERTEQLANDVSRLGADVQALRGALPPEGTILRLAERTETAEKQVRDIAAQHASAQALLLVVGQLREAIDRGDPYGFELQAVRRIIAGQDDLDRIDSLAGSAEEGIPRKQELSSRWPTVAKDILRAALAQPDGDLWQRTLYKLTSLVSVRQLDGQGAGATAIVGRTETWVKDGDLAKAVHELSKLEGAPSAAAASWLRAAQARVTAQRALSELSASAAAQTAKGGS